MDSEQGNSDPELSKHEGGAVTTGPDSGAQQDKSPSPPVNSGGIKERLFRIFKRDTLDPDEKLSEIAGLNSEHSEGQEDAFKVPNPPTEGKTDELQDDAVEDGVLREYKGRVDKSREPMGLKAGLCNVYDVPPAHESQKPPVILTQGFAVTKPRYRNMQPVTDEDDRRLIALYPASRYGGEVEKMDGIYSEDMRKAMQIIEVLERKGLKDVDAIGKSGGAAATVIAALLRPDLISTVALFNPSGMREDSPLGIAKRFVKKNNKSLSYSPKDPEVDLSKEEAKNEVLSTLFKNPKRTIQEIVAFGGADVNELMRRAKEKGVMISVMASADDTFFPVDTTIKRLRELRGQSIDPSPFVGFYSVRGGHDDPFGDDPLRMRLCMNALDNMRTLRDKKKLQQNVSG